MKKILLFASFLFSFFAISAQSNKYYAWAGIFDDLEVGKTFPVVDASGNAVEGATAVVEADANDPDNKVSMMLAHIGEDRDVDDPWYTGDFERTFRELFEACGAILEGLS